MRCIRADSNLDNGSEKSYRTLGIRYFLTVRVSECVIDAKFHDATAVGFSSCISAALLIRLDTEG